MPSEFYTAMQLEELAKITGVTLKDLSKVHPNDDAIKFLLDKLDWFFNEFLLREEMTKERDGKIAGELVVKALQKVISRSPAHAREDLQAEYERRRKQ